MLQINIEKNSDLQLLILKINLYLKYVEIMLSTQDLSAVNSWSFF